MNAIQKVINIRQRMEHSKPSREELCNTLGDLMQKYGIELTVAATGWKVSTIEQYLRNKKAQINAEVLSRAVDVLKEWERNHNK